MHRNSLQQLLTNYQPEDIHEKNSKQKILSFITQQPRCFERTLEIGHITASCWLVNHDNSKALLTRHKKLNLWIQLGGHCDGHSDVLEVALKEAREESGIQTIKPVYSSIFDIDVHLIPEYKNEKAHYHYDIRFLLQAANETIVISDESDDLLWIDKNKNNLPSQTKEIIRMFNKWILIK